MIDPELLAEMLEELIDVSQLQAKELEKMITHVEQVAPRIPDTTEIALVRSRLAALHVRIKKLNVGPESA